MLISPSLQKADDILCIPNLEQWVQLYLDNCTQKLRKPTTRTHYANALKRFTIWHATRLSDGQFSRQQAGDFAYWLANIKQKFDDHPGRPTEDRLSPATVRRSVGVIRTFFTWLYEEGYLPRDFACWFPFPRLRMPPKRIIAPATVAAILTGATLGEMPIRDITLIALLADTGLRRKEIVTLRLEQIHWLNNDNQGYLQDVEGKADRLRTVPFSGVVGTVLSEWLEQRSTFVSSDKPVQQVFVTPQGKPLQLASIYQVLRRSARRAGVADRVWNTHSFRHNFATHHWRVQRDTKSLSLILGHSSQKVTEDIYVHPTPEDLLAAHTSIMATGQVKTPEVISRRRQSPTREQLHTAIQQAANWRQLGAQFQMSDVAVRKLAIRYDLLNEYYTVRQQIPLR